MVTVLTAMVLLSALTVVYDQYKIRRLFLRSQQLEQIVEAYEIEWGQLQLEQTTWGRHARVERIARDTLGMKRPKQQQILYLEP